MSPLTASISAPLLTIDSVRMLRRKSVDAIYELVDGDKHRGGTLFEPGLKWVFNLATDPKGKIRDLRFFAPEISKPESIQDISLDQVIATILPPTVTNFHSGRVQETLVISRPTLMELRSQLGGELQTDVRSCFFARASLVAFLKARHL